MEVSLGIDCQLDAVGGPETPIRSVGAGEVLRVEGRAVAVMGHQQAMHQLLVRNTKTANTSIVSVKVATRRATTDETHAKHLDQELTL